jgi:tetratricopeptide (TPR) repeat protein
MSKAVAIFAFLVLAYCTQVNAVEIGATVVTPAMVGDQVVATQPLELKLNGKLIETVRPGNDFKVLGVEGKRIQLDTVPPVWVDGATFVEPLKAVEHFTKLLVEKPGDWKLLVARGWSHELSGAPYLAMLDISEAVRLHPIPETYRSRASFWRHRKDLRQALDDLDEAVRIDPKSAVNYQERARLLVDVGRHEEAIVDLSKAIEFDQGKAALYVARAHLRARVGKFADATLDIEDALRLAPDDLDVLSQKGNILGKRGKVDEAIKIYTYVLERNPRAVYVLLDRGCQWQAKNQLDKAIADFNAAVEIDPSAMAFSLRGNAFSAKKEFVKATADFEKALALEPTNVEIRLFRGTAYLNRGDFEKALTDSEVLILREPNQIQGYQLRGLARLQMGRPSETIGDSDAVIRLAPHHAQGYLLRGMALRKLQRWDEATRDFQQTLKCDGDNLSAIKQLAWIFAAGPVAETRNGKVAVDLSQKAVKLSLGSDCDAISALAASFAETGDFKRAVENQKRAIELSTSESRKEAQDRLSLYESRKPYRLQ